MTASSLKYRHDIYTIGNNSSILGDLFEFLKFKTLFLVNAIAY